MNKLLEDTSIFQEVLNNFLEQYFKKYFTKKQVEKLNEIIKKSNK
jgi:hypothetical protein